MPRYCCLLEYDGSFFSGWQFQPGLETVQGRLQEAVAQLTQETISVQGAGRTDRGVHALGQVAHMDLSKSWDPLTLRHGLNFYLKGSAVTVSALALAPEDFHARFCAKARSYQYLILNRNNDSPLLSGRAFWCRPVLALSAMQEAAAMLIGHHDFSSFRSRECQCSSPMKTLDCLSVEKQGPLITIRTKARSFLHNQVRIMVGALIAVGRGRFTPQHVQKILEQRDRTKSAPTMPAYGLYLTSVTYENDPLDIAHKEMLDCGTSYFL